MRKFIAWPTAWAMFWVGHFVSVVFLRRDWTVNRAAFHAYQWLMQTSGVVQDWAGLSSPWKEPEGENA